MAIKFATFNLDTVIGFNDDIIKKILKTYEDKEIDEFYKQIKVLKDVDFCEEEAELRSCLNITMFSNIEDIIMKDITDKYITLRKSINKVIAIKNKFNDYKKQWLVVQKIVDSMYERNKDANVISEDMKIYKNKDEKLSATNKKLDQLIRAMTFVEIIILKLKQFESEIRDAMEYLMDVKQDVSRIMSAISLALDTGEIPRVYWRDRNGK